MGRVGGYTIPYFEKDHLFTKADLINRMKNIPETQKYLQDNIRLESL